ncbi:MAG TPA: SH3 domain-containing protein [Anaerolineales bacterium]|nr:SH3 domain-containing protein [Anaerolineales bacterium]
MLTSRFLILAILFAFISGACAPVTTPAIPTPTSYQPAPANPTLVQGIAGVTDVDIQITQNSPLQVTAVVHGELPDAGCTSISGAQQARIGNTFQVSLATTTDPLAICAQALTPFEYAIPLDINNLPFGNYTVNVHGIEQSFELLPRDLMGYRLSLVEALNARNYDLLKVMMGDSFLIGYWLSEGTTNTPDAAIEQLRNNLLNSSSPVTADHTRNLIELLGIDPVTFVGPDIVEASPLLVTGLGSAGRDQAILFTAKQPDGSLYWHGLLFAKDGFAKPTPTPQPVDTNAYPTTVKYIMAQKDVRMRTGPGTQFSILGYIAAGQTAKVTGVSANGDWWRVICPDGSESACWVSADYSLTKPTDSPFPDATAYPTNVQYILAQRDMTMYGGPSNLFNVVGYIASGQIAKVTGVNINSTWWRVICPDSTTGSCWVSADPTLTKPTDLTANANVQSVEISILESYPLQVNAVARGQLPDAGCTTISAVNQTLNSNTFIIKVTTKYNPQVVCGQVLTPFEQVISLDVNNLLPGTYFVNINSIETSFQLPQPVLQTDISYVIAHQDTSIYNAPSTLSSILGAFYAGQIARVTGVNPNGTWWRVICQDDTVGNCWVSADTNITNPTDMTGSADVQTLEVKILESNPVQVNAIARGQLPDAGCTTISEVKQRREGNIFNVQVLTKFNLQAFCAQILTPFEQVISLDVSSLLPGTYIARVNGVDASFQLPTPSTRTFPLPQ